jgi:carnitine-CoA ligase
MDTTKVSEDVDRFAEPLVDVSRAQGYVERLLRKRCAASPEALWLTFTGQEFTWGAALSMAQRAANGLLGLGIRPGDCVAIMASNKPDFIWVYFGVLMIGGRAVPLNCLQRGRALEHIVKDAGVSTIVMDSDLRDVVLPLKEVCSRLVRCVNFGPTVADGCDACYADIIAGADRAPPVEVLTPSAPVSIIYTSGTTGRPKGIVIEEDRFFYEGLAAACDIKEGETMYSCLPLFHGNALYLSVLGSMYLNAKLVLAERFSASRFWDECRRYNAVQINVLGNMVPILMKQEPLASDTDNPVRAALSFGCPAMYWRAFEERFGVKIVECYSLSDSVGYMINRSGPVGSVGRPSDGMDFRVVDETDRVLPPLSIGEIVVKTEHGRATTYNNMPEETDRAYRGGWFHTGDLGEVDKEGWFYFRGRLKEMIRRKGENISIWEVEAAFRDHPDIADVAAFAVSAGNAETAEEEIMVAVVPKAGHTCDPAEIMSYSEHRLAKYAVPRYIEIVDELPKTATEKVQRNVLTERGVTPRAWDRSRNAYAISG